MLIIHGDNQVASRSLLLASKQAAAAKNLEVVSLSGDDLVLTDLQNYVGSTNLLGDVNCVAIEGFFSRRPSNEKKKIADYLGKNQDKEIILWDGKDIGAQAKDFDIKIVKKFELPKTVFKFLDTLSLSDLALTLETTPPEFVFSLLVGQVRKMIQVKSGLVNLPSWQIAKLKSSKLSLDKLLVLHQELIKIDYKNKTSSSSLDLGSALEVWSAKINVSSADVKK